VVFLSLYRNLVMVLRTGVDSGRAVEARPSSGEKGVWRTENPHVGFDWGLAGEGLRLVRNGSQTEARDGSRGQIVSPHWSILFFS
jgi:hypothetical protein